jgi:glycosyltransferase involved in cell wall biosynthesis
MVEEVNTENQPFVSVVMGVRNGLPHLDEAVGSVLAQTYPHMEFIVLDDFSDDATYECLSKWAEKDSRLHVFKAEKNLGMGGARDFCIQRTSGEFIAFMDADDISLPNRLEAQVEFLQANPDAVAVGTQTTLIDEEGAVIGEKTFPTDPDLLADMLYLYAPMQIPTVMIRRSALPGDFRWFEGWRYAEDTVLFFKLLQYGKLGNVDEKLYEYRQHAASAFSTKAKVIFYHTWKARGIGRTQYGYKAGVKKRMLSGLQFIAVSCLPTAWVYSFYQRLRGYLQKISGHEKDAF